MATTIYRADDPPSSYTKLYSGNWLIVVTSGSCLYSTDQGASWYRVDTDSGKIEVTNSYLYIEDTSGTAICYQMAQKAVAVFE